MLEHGYRCVSFVLFLSIIQPFFFSGPDNLGRRRPTGKKRGYLLLIRLPRTKKSTLTSFLLHHLILPSAGNHYHPPYLQLPPKNPTYSIRQLTPSFPPNKQPPTPPGSAPSSIMEQSLSACAFYNCFSISPILPNFRGLKKGCQKQDSQWTAA